MGHSQKLAVFSLLMLLGGCVVNRTGPGPEDYVEIPNPAITMTPDAPATVWVPRSYVEDGVPRGRDLVKKGYESVRGAAQSAGRAAESAPQRENVVAVQPDDYSQLKNRMALLEIGTNGLLNAFSDKMANAAVGVITPPSQSAPLVKDFDLGNQAGRAAVALDLQQKLGTTLVVFISAPDQLAAGSSIKGEIFDGMAGELLRSVSVAIPSFTAGNAVERNAAVSKALNEVVQKTKRAVALFPWAGKVVSVEGDRVYLNAGSESGVGVGHTLRLHRPGKVVAGLGYAPGEDNGTLEIAGLVGANGAYGVVKANRGVKAGDIVTVR